MHIGFPIVITKFHIPPDFVVDGAPQRVKVAHVIDFPLLHAVGSSDQLQNNANNIKVLAFYHEIRWGLEFAAIPVYIFGVQETGREHVRLCVGAPEKPRTVFSLL